MGEKQLSIAMDDATSRSQASLKSWLDYTYSLNSQTLLAEQVTRTVYDLPAILPLVSGTTAYGFHQKGYTLRNRVSNTLLYNVLLPGTPDPQYDEYSNGSYFSYDIHGNVDTLLHDYRLGLMATNGANRFKLTAYNYDLISGKVNQVHYQPGEKDQFYHRYEYDAENRITGVFTTDVKEFVGTGSNEDHEALYQYYKHGPLARTLLGHQQVQGIDYAYTLQGWLKGVNSTSLMPDRDMGEDDGTFIARDVYGFNLNYFTGDYSAIHDTKIPFPGHTAFIPSGEYKGLYNGNISSMAVNIAPPLGGVGGGFAPQLYNYHYVQLNRIVSMDAYKGLDQTNNSWSPLSMTTNYKERVTYDANGNILKYFRNGATAGGSPLAMDSLNYNYFTDAGGNKRNNRLRMVRDAVNAANYTEDIDDQLSSVNNVADSNYVYDEIGNLVQDKSEKITSIKWNVYGKILEISKNPTTTNPVTKISYSYDAAGNRISKKTEKGETSETTWYVRDAQGNVLGVYTDKNALTLTEHHIYGSSRLGITNRSLTVADPSVTGTSLNLLGSSYLSNFERGKKFFELSNHLGNVLVTITDRKLQITNSGSVGEDNGGCEIGSGVDVLDVNTRNGELSYTARTEVNLLPGFESNGTTDIYDAYIDNSLDSCVPYTPPAMLAQGWYYAADVIGANDYYPFGSLMPGRKFSSDLYRYGFNGKENDNDVKGYGNQQDYGMRIYDSRLGKFLSVDPISEEYPELTPYQFASNRPIDGIDLDGLEWNSSNDQKGSIRNASSDDYDYRPVYAFFKDVSAYLLNWFTPAGAVDDAIDTYTDKNSSTYDKINASIDIATAPNFFTKKPTTFETRPVESLSPKNPGKVTPERPIVKASNEENVSQTTNKPVEQAHKGNGEASTSNTRTTNRIPNKISGDKRQAAETAALKAQHPNADIQDERYLRDANGKIVKDPLSGKGRRIDHAVVEDKKVIKLVETTSLTANKKQQAEREARIRDAGGTYIRDKKTKKLMDVKSIPTRTSRRQ